MEANEVYLGSRKSWIKTFIDFILPVARRFYSPQRGGMGTIMKLGYSSIARFLYTRTIVEHLGYFVVMHKNFTTSAVSSNACSDKFL